MELRHLRAFVEVAAKRHFGRAAAALSLTQPALTLRVQALEKELGTDLFDRSGRVMRLTRAGEVLLPYARRLVEVENQALAEIRQHVAAREGKLRIAYLTLWDGLPTNLVSMFRRRHAEVRIETTSGYSTENLERVVNREADLAFLNIGVGHRPGVVVRVLERHPMGLIMAANHRLSARASIPVSELRGERFIGLSSGVNDAFAKDLIAWLTRHTGEQPTVVASEPPDQIASAVATSGDAVAVMTEARASVSQSVGIVYRKLEPTPMIEYGIAFRKDNPSQPLADFLEAIDDSVPTITDGLPAGYEAVSRSSPARAATKTA